MADVQSPNDPQFLQLIRLAGDVAIWILKPIWTALYYISFAILIVLKLIWRPLEFILLPFIYLGSFFLTCLAAPFRFLAKFETLYIYLGIASIIGIAGGVVISLIGGAIHKLLGFDVDATPKIRTAREYRKEKRAPTTGQDQRATALAGPSAGPSSGMRKKGKQRRSGKTPTIMEELDSDE